MSPFARLWAADGTNHLGTAVRVTAMPLIAVTTLGASAWQVGLLAAAATIAYLVVGLPAGVWVDRWPRRRVMVIANSLRALLLLSLPITAAFGRLDYAQLLVVAVLTGTMTVFFEVAAPAMAQSLLAAEARIGANSRMQTTQATARLGGPPLTGLLAQLAGAASAIGLSGLAYLTSAMLARGLPDQPPLARTGRRNLRAELVEGLRFTFGDPILGTLAIGATAYNFFYNIGAAVQVLFLASTLDQPELAVGVLLAMNGLGQAIGAATAGQWSQRLGLIRAMLLVPLVTQPFLLLLPLADDGIALGLFAGGVLIAGYGLGVDNVLSVTVRQGVCPPSMYGRMGASSRFVAWGVMPLGAFGGGLLAEFLGVRTALWVAATGASLSGVWLWLRLRRTDPKLLVSCAGGY